MPGPLTGETRRVLFLPGAGGQGVFWRPVAERLPFPCDPVLFDWPGLGDVPPDPRVRSIDDLVSLVLDRMDRPVDLIAQSMGGVVAIRAALERPAMVRRLVLAVTSGGVDLSRFRAADWRPDYRREFPTAASWILDRGPDMSDRIRTVEAPMLLLWGDADPISPVAVGEYLAGLLPNARLVVINGGGHTMARDRAAEIAPHIARHLSLEPA